MVRLLRLLPLCCLLLGLSLPVMADQAIPAADTPERWLELLQGKRLGAVVNASSRTQGQHLVDFLQVHKLGLKRIFAPEHGLRGGADAGAEIQNETDARSGLPVISLYGANKAPTPEQMNDLDALIFDIQDVGVRFYTYISTLHYLLEAAAAAGKEVIVLDRPNPNGDYVDGPMLEPAWRSFVGADPLPLVYGLTIGELAKMMQGEGWVAHADKLKLTVVPMAGYTRRAPYAPPVRPSPNLPNARAIRLYPSLGLFEGTVVSVGRGTDWPFQVLGLPLPGAGKFSFTPTSRPGATSPPYLNRPCYGLDLRQGGSARFTLNHLLHFYRLYHASPATEPGFTPPFFNPFFDKLAGSDKLRIQIEAGWDEARIRAAWKPALAAYRAKRAKYLLYAD